VIVNADDFGLDSSTNGGIVAAFRTGLISSTTLMANQPGYEEAVELAHEHGLADHVGVHLVLTRGMPLTEPIRRLRRFCNDDGAFVPWHAEARAWRLSSQEREATLEELSAQVQRIRASRLPVTHLDSHHQVHNDWPIGSCVISVARSAGIRRVRIARNCGAGISAASAAYKRLFNWRLHRRGLAGTRWFGGAEQWAHLREHGASAASLDDFELMTHPMLDGPDRLVDALAGVDLAAVLAPVSGIAAAVSYSGTRYIAVGSPT
jgi:predicted glycoside hydrolase/deacetylase ChbG (UPF0249 family)